MLCLTVLRELKSSAIFATIFTPPHSLGSMLTSNAARPTEAILCLFIKLMKSDFWKQMLLKMLSLVRGPGLDSEILDQMASLIGLMIVSDKLPTGHLVNLQIQSVYFKFSNFFLSPYA